MARKKLKRERIAFSYEVRFTAVSPFVAQMYQKAIESVVKSMIEQFPVAGNKVHATLTGHRYTSLEVAAEHRAHLPGGDNVGLVAPKEIKQI